MARAATKRCLEAITSPTKQRRCTGWCHQQDADGGWSQNFVNIYTSPTKKRRCVATTIDGTTLLWLLTCHWSLSKSILGNLGNLPNLGNNALLFQHTSKCPLLTATRVTIKAFSWLPLLAAGYSSHGGFGQLLRSHVQMANGWSQLASPWRRGPKGDLEGLPSGECV